MADAKKILIVDDNQLILMMSKDILEGAGFEVAIQNSPLGVSETARKVQPDLVLLDVNMPALQGDQVLDILRKYEQMKGVPVIYFSDRPVEELAALTEKTGADGYIPKSSMGETLIDDVKRFMAAGGSASTEEREYIVLVVDHDRSVLTVLEGFFKDTNYGIDVATGANEGLAKAAKGEYIAIVTDANLPGMNGIYFYEQVIKERPVFRDRVIFMTAVPTTGFLSAVRKTGCDYIVKPVVPTELVDKIRTIKEKAGIHEKRRAERYSWAGSCKLKVHGAEVSGKVLDISTTGVKVRYTGEPVEKGEKVGAIIKALAMVRDGEVMWVDRAGEDTLMGLHFDKEIPTIYIEAVLSK